jgi:hypothetical protein
MRWIVDECFSDAQLWNLSTGISSYIIRVHLASVADPDPGTGMGKKSGSGSYIELYFKKIFFSIFYTGAAEMLYR